MNRIKKAMGILWMLIGPLSIILLVLSAIDNINSAGSKDINNPVPWIIIITIFTPIAAGLVVFGWYCWKGEYEQLD